MAGVVLINISVPNKTIAFALILVRESMYLALTQAEWFFRYGLPFHWPLTSELRVPSSILYVINLLISPFVA